MRRWWLRRPEVVRQGAGLASHDKEVYQASRRGMLARYARDRVASEGPYQAGLARDVLAAREGPVDLYRLAAEMLLRTSVFHYMGVEVTVGQTQELADLHVLRQGSTSFTSTTREWLLDHSPSASRRRRGREAQRGFVAALLELQDSGGGDIPELVRRGVVNAVAVEGLPGAVGGLTCMLVEFARNERLRSTLRAHAEVVLAGKSLPPEYEDAINEALRLTCPWRTNRVVIKPFTACGVSFERGDFLVASSFLLHRDARFWPVPDSFSLVNWEPERMALRHRRAFIPFGFPSRACVGRHMVYVQTAALVAAVARDWRLSLETTCEWHAEPNSELTPAAPGFRGSLSRRA